MKYVIAAAAALAAIPATAQSASEGAQPAVVEAPVQAPRGDRTHYVDPTLDPKYPFSAAVVVGDTIFLAGQLGVDRAAGRGLVEGGVAAETTQIFKNYEAVLKSLGSDLSDIVKCTVFLDDMSEFGEMNKAYAAALPSPKPARSTFGVEALALGASLEIECTAVRGHGGE
ncbi:MAG: Rid family hydrolase [Pseudomonadota bacterium]